MIELQIYVEPFEGKEKELESVFWNDFLPKVSIQKGFQRAVLLKSQNALREYRIHLTFDTEELRLKWVASTEHQEVWPKVASLCTRASWSGFDLVEKPV